MIPQVKKILYTTDLSKNSVYAFYHAVDMAKKYDAKICMLHVIETIPASAYGTRTDKLYQDQREAAEAVIRNRIRNFCDRVDQKKNLACMERIAKILVENGDPAQEILKAAEQEGCNLMVLGRHGKGFLEQTFLFPKYDIRNIKISGITVMLPSDCLCIQLRRQHTQTKA